MINIDALQKYHDWPKRTPDRYEDLVQKFDPQQRRDEKGRWAEQHGVQAPALGTSTAQMKAEPMPATLTAAEDRIRHEPREHGFLAKDGVPFKVLGDDERWHVRQDGATDEDLKDVVFTHNHPSGLGLSNKDGIMAARKNMLEMRAVAADGTHSIRRTSTDWPAHFDEHIADMHADLMLELGLQLHEGTITVEQANRTHHIEMYRRLQAKVGGFLYTFEPKQA